MQGKTVFFLPMPSGQEQKNANRRWASLGGLLLLTVREEGDGVGGEGGGKKAERKRRSSKCSSFKIRDTHTHTHIQFDSLESQVTRANEKLVQTFSFEEATRQYGPVPDSVSQLPFSLR